MEKKEYKTEVLFQYMKKRSKVENQNWDLTIDFLEEHFENGIRNFFGVELLDNGLPVIDFQQPYPSFFIETMKEIITSMKKVYKFSESDFEKINKHTLQKTL